MLIYLRRTLSNGKSPGINTQNITSPTWDSWEKEVFNNPLVLQQYGWGDKGGYINGKVKIQKPIDCSGAACKASGESFAPYTEFVDYDAKTDQSFQYQGDILTDPTAADRPNRHRSGITAEGIRNLKDEKGTSVWQNVSNQDEARDGDFIYMKGTNTANHIAQVIVDEKTGVKYIVESRFGKGPTISPFKKRINELKQVSNNNVEVGRIFADPFYYQAGRELEAYYASSKPEIREQELVLKEIPVEDKIIDGMTQLDDIDMPNLFEKLYASIKLRKKLW